MTERKFNEMPACSVKSSPFLIEVTCPQCSSDIEIWSNEDDAICRICGYVVSHYD